MRRKKPSTMLSKLGNDIGREVALLKRKKQEIEALERQALQKISLARMRRAGERIVSIESLFNKKSPALTKFNKKIYGKAVKHYCATMKISEEKKAKLHKVFQKYVGEEIKEREAVIMIGKEMKVLPQDASRMFTTIKSLAQLELEEILVREQLQIIDHGAGAA